MPGSYRQIEEGIHRLLEHDRSSRPIVRVRMTLSNRNANEIRAFYQKWHKVADDVLLQPVHHCTDAYYTGMDEAELYLDPRLIAQEIADTALENDGYLKRLIESLETCGSFPHHQCYAAVMMERIDPWGNVYPCLEQHVRVGSIREKDFQTIWNSDLLKKERQRLATNRTCRCWYNNTALIGHYGMWDLVRHTVACNIPSVFSKKI
jgi:MoaA/NifB/PqqE/SkfB family radical SAM enzyme